MTGSSPPVPDLPEDFSARLMHGVCHCAQFRNALLRMGGRRDIAAAVMRGHAENHEPAPASNTREIVLSEVFRRTTGGCRQRTDVRGIVEPVGNFDRSQPY